MLQAIRNRAQGIFAWVMLILIGVPFALWGIQNYMDGGKEKPVAVVGERDIFERDVNRIYEQNLESLAAEGQFDEKHLKEEALDRLIKEELIGQSAYHKGLAVSDEQMRVFVQALPYFQTNGRFDKEKYKQLLGAQNMTPAQFADQIQKALIMEQYQRSVTDTAFVTSQQLQSFYKLRNQKRQIEYITVPLKPFTGDVSDARIEAFYRENKASFQNPEKISVDYLGISLDDIAQTIQVSEEDLKNLYEEQKAQYTTPERRKVSHILLAVESEEAAASVQEKALKLRERLMKGEDFSNLAKEVSDDKESAVKGGDLGFVDKETMDPAFSSAAFALAKGEISQPVKTPFGFHLIKLTELTPAVIKPYESVKAELSIHFKRNAAENKFYELGQKLTEQSFEHPDSLEPAAKALNLKIQQTSLFTRESGEGIAALAQVREKAFSTDVLDGRNSEPAEINSEKVFVLRMHDHELASDKPLNEVKQAVIAKLRIQEAKDLAKKQAEQMLNEANQGKALADLAKASNLKLNKPEALQRNTDQLPPVLISAVFKAKMGVKGHPGFFLAEFDNGDQALIGLLSVSDGDIAGVDPKELEMARDYLSKNFGQRDFAAYVEQLREDVKVHIRAQAE